MDSNTKARKATAVDGGKTDVRRISLALDKGRLFSVVIDGFPGGKPKTLYATVKDSDELAKVIDQALHSANWDSLGETAKAQ